MPYRSSGSIRTLRESGHGPRPPFQFDLSSGGYRVSGTVPGKRLDVYRYGSWCGSIAIDRGQVSEVSVTVRKGNDPFPRDEAVKALRRILGTPDEASQVEGAKAESVP